LWPEPYPDEVIGVEDGYAAREGRYEERESVELASVAALQHLPASEHAVLILRDLLGSRPARSPSRATRTVAAVDSSMQRARKTVDERLPKRGRQEALRELGNGRLRELA
jgi:RNA polymerase sigma-70 factor, ECF subfamily